MTSGKGTSSAKFNPYHDELGRFTTADGAGGGSGDLLQPAAFKPRGGGSKPPKSPGETTPPLVGPGSQPQYRKPKSGLSGKEAASDIPSWVRGERPLVGEDGKGFAKRVLDQKYGVREHDAGPSSEFSQLKKFADRALD